MRLENQQIVKREQRVNKLNSEYLLLYTKKNEKILVFPNYVDPSEWHRLDVIQQSKNYWKSFFFETWPRKVDDKFVLKSFGISIQQKRKIN